MRLVPSAKMAAVLYAQRKGVTRGNVCEAHRTFHVRYI